MLEAIFLILIVGGIVVLARRWPDIERRLFPDDVMASHADVAAEPTEQTATPASPTTAQGFLHTKPVDTEPDVDPAAVRAKDIVEPITPPTPTPPPPPAAAEEVAEEHVEVKEEVIVEESVTDEGIEETRTTVTDTVTVTEDRKPGGLVTGNPARPSEPAYLDATGGDDSSSDLADTIDRAYRDRDYETAEQACLKLLSKEPKNHKYMTRLGQIYQEMNQLEDAKQAFEEAKKIDPKNFFVLNRLTEVDRLLSDKGGRTKSKK